MRNALGRKTLLALGFESSKACGICGAVTFQRKNETCCPECGWANLYDETWEQLGVHFNWRLDSRQVVAEMRAWNAEMEDLDRRLSA